MDKGNVVWANKETLLNLKTERYFIIYNNMDETVVNYAR